MITLRWRGWTDAIEATRPGDLTRTYRPGAQHFALIVRLPVRLAAFFARFVAIETELTPHASDDGVVA